MALSKSEVELEKLRMQAQMKGRYIDLVKLAMQLGAGLGLAWMFLNSLESLVLANPERLKALSTLVTSMSLDRIVPWLLAGGAGVAYAKERSGKKRLVKKLADKRGAVEASDPYAGSSGLDETGETPILED